jgi:hypothetical protein
MKVALFIAMLMFPVLGFGQHWVAGVRVNVPPPVVRVEVRPQMPSPRHQWIGGYWAWRGGRHQWMSGHWALPPQPGYVWEPAEWVNQDGAWMFYDGHWRSGEAADPAVVYQPPPPPVQQQVVEVAPPPLLEEVRPAAPFEGAYWVPGYWHWNGGRHVWVSGRWTARPAGYGWEAHRWDRRPDGRWISQPGHWHPHDDRQ